MYTCDWQTRETVDHRGQNKLRNRPSSRTQFLYFQSRTNVICFSFAIDERSEKIEDSKGDRQLSCCWLPGRCSAGFPSRKTLAQTTILRHYHCTSIPFPPVPLSARDAQETTEHSQNSVSSLCLLTDLFSNSIK